MLADTESYSLYCATGGLEFVMKLQGAQGSVELGLLGGRTW